MTDHEKVADILASWHESRAQGVDADADELLKAHPELADELRSNLATLEILDRAFSNPGEKAAGPPQNIGPYRILREIGRGGMGVVYEAEQTSMERRVALKVLSPSITNTARSLQRFKLEARIAGILHHTNIVPVHDMGQHAGYSYYAMELVQGWPLSRVLDDLRSGGERAENARARMAGSTASGEQRKESRNGQGSVDGQGWYRIIASKFVGVAEALALAHGQGIVHRDVKPGNLLLDADGTLKLVDFGLAHLEANGPTMTRSGDVLGTPAYMSPEQAAAKPQVDHRTDIYSLGATLYEVLTLEPPFEGENLVQLYSHIATVDPVRPRATDRRIPKDLETIVLKAIEKERQRRYDSAAALADDLRRYLNDEPIVARPASAIYQFGKFARRNKALVGGVGVAAAAILVGLTAVSWKNAQLNDALGELSSTNVALTAEKRALLESEASANLQRREAVASRESEREARLAAEENEARARTQALKASTVVELLGNMLSSADPHEVNGPNYTVRQLLDNFDAGLGNRLQDQPEVEITVRQTMGRAYRGLGLMDKAERHLSRALDLARGELREDPNTLMWCLRDWAQLQHDRGRYAEAEGTLREELELLSWPAEEGEEIAGGVSLLGDVLRHLGRYEESERLNRDALAMALGLPGEDDGHVVAIFMSNLALALIGQGKHAEAERVLRQALELQRKLFGDDEHPGVASSLNNLAVALSGQGKHAEAVRVLRQALKLERKLFGDEHPKVVQSLSNLTAIHWKWLTSRREALGADHLDTLATQSGLGVLLWSQGSHKEAEPLLLDCLEKRTAVLGEDHADTLASLYHVARLHASLQRWEEAEAAAGWLLELTPEDAAEYAEREQLLERVLEALDGE